MVEELPGSEPCIPFGVVDSRSFTPRSHILRRPILFHILLLFPKCSTFISSHRKLEQIGSKTSWEKERERTVILREQIQDLFLLILAICSLALREPNCEPAPPFETLLPSPSSSHTSRSSFFFQQCLHTQPSFPPTFIVLSIFRSFFLDGTEPPFSLSLSIARLGISFFVHAHGCFKSTLGEKV